MKSPYRLVNLLVCLSAFGFDLPCLGHGRFGIPEDWDEVEVEHAAVAGGCLSDSVCDITGARVVDPDAEYRAKRVAQENGYDKVTYTPNEKVLGNGSTKKK